VGETGDTYVFSAAVNFNDPDPGEFDYFQPNWPSDPGYAD
jgi:hypothetical protein